MNMNPYVVNSGKSIDSRDHEQANQLVANQIQFGHVFGVHGVIVQYGSIHMRISRKMARIMQNIQFYPSLSRNIREHP